MNLLNEPILLVLSSLFFIIGIWFFAFMRRRSRRSRPDKQSEAKPVWCIVANVAHERAYGPDGVEKRRGTKHFPPGAKIYVLSFFWGMGGERVTVVGRHRGSHRYVKMVIASGVLTNWRVESVYSPHLIRMIWSFGEYDRVDPSGTAAKRRAEKIVARWTASAAGQPASR